VHRALSSRQFAKRLDESGIEPLRRAGATAPLVLHGPCMQCRLRDIEHDFEDAAHELLIV
jgi:hypothetical protein